MRLWCARRLACTGARQWMCKFTHTKKFKMQACGCLIACPGVHGHVPAHVCTLRVSMHVWMHESAANQPVTRQPAARVCQARACMHASMHGQIGMQVQPCKMTVCATVCGCMSAGPCVHGQVPAHVCTLRASMCVWMHESDCKHRFGMHNCSNSRRGNRSDAGPHGRACTKACNMLFVSHSCMHP